MSSVSIAGDTSGSILLAAPAVAGSSTLTLPTQTGTLNIQGPAFAVWKSSDQSISASTWTKVTFDTEEYDTNSNFASSRFTPTVAGYYQINWCTDLSATSCTRQMTSLYKNGQAYKYVGLWTQPSGNWEHEINGSSIVYFNGTTDYAEVYVYINGTSPAIYSTSEATVTWFNGCFLRGA